MLRGAGDFVSVAVDSRRKPVPVDAFPVAARRVVHDEPAGDHERVVACLACLARLARERPLLVRNLDLGLLLLALKPEPGSAGMVKNGGDAFASPLVPAGCFSCTHGSYT